MRRCWMGWLIALVCALPAFGAAELTDAQRQVLDDTATDFDADLDFGPAMYVLLTNAADWAVDDFAGERGAAKPPPPDYGYLAEHPGQVRGELFLIEGQFFEQVRYPQADRDGRDHLQRAGHPAWGDQLTGWGIKVGAGDDDVVMVYFVDPDHAIQPPKRGDTVRIAARFYKVWSVPNRDGKALDFLAFIGGGREVVDAHAGKSTGNGNWNKIVIVLLVMAAGGYYGARLLLSRKASAAGAHSQAILDQRHRARDEEADDDPDAIDPDLPDDPAQALAYLEAKDMENDQ